MIVVLLTTVKLVASTPPKLTLVVALKLVPVMVIVLPVVAVAGVNEVTVGVQGVGTLAIKLPIV